MSRLPIEIKEKAFKLRVKGYSIKEIADKLDIAKSTVSLWVRDIKLNKKAQERLKKRRLLSYYKIALRWETKRKKEQEELNLIARNIVKEIKNDINQKRVYCSLLYWCEGAKGYNDSIRFVNSDPLLIKTFLKLFRDSFPIKESKFRVLMYLHSYHNEKLQKEFWSNLTQISKNQFNKTFLKPNTKKRIRNDYPGCVAISYHDRKLARLLRAIYKSFSEKIGA